jgi:hypothetical protein
VEIRVTIIGLDIGGANLKAAALNGPALQTPFALWKHPDHLPAMLGEVLAQLPCADLLAVTMTGELCDCYSSRRAGVNAILDAVRMAAQSTPVRVWTNQGEFVEVEQARQEALTVASANWLALATWVGRMFPQGPVLLLDIGTTTTDIVPIVDGQPRPKGRTDHQRMLHHELVYLGWRRTPVCAVVQGVAAEWFATMHDVFLVLGLTPDDPQDKDTADGRPATGAFAKKRLARMWGADLEDMSDGELIGRAVYLLSMWHSAIAKGIEKVVGPTTRTSWNLALSGSGDFLGHQVWNHLRSQNSGQSWKEPISLTTKMGKERSAAACAVAVATLAATT